MKIAGIIPARYGSTRFPGKPLALINGKTMIRRVYEQVLKTESISIAIVATDDQRIFDEVISFGGLAAMTSPAHKSGTDRCAEVLENLDTGIDIVINIQGDEPFIDPRQIDQLARMFENPLVEIATLASPVKTDEELSSPNTVKVVAGKDGRALYFSRYPIPFLRSSEGGNISGRHSYLKHIGIYGYRSEILRKIVKLELSDLEIAESLEQLRWLENGFSIFVSNSQSETVSIDTPEDLSKIINI
ncbi:MAG: 3-deoxy-manno-octulosonate cytidylyltransferase [Bacteroidales bacterium]|nr:3-deoxy-manno-octulosonate cytidylyltransferase [Bacteroidales bacterium]